MHYEQITEGKVTINVPKTRKLKKSDTVFYNPDMEFNRDISVSVISAFNSKGDFCDCLSATGIRALRYSKECGLKGVANDLNPSAVKLIKKNTKGRNIKVTKKDARLVLAENKFGIIDVDPFGSPAPFLDAAARSIAYHGLLAITATDTAPLSGTYPMKCLKRYGIKNFKTPFHAEMGLRILLTTTILTCARHDKTFTPLLSFAKRHYFRIFGRIDNSGKVGKLLKTFGYLSYCECGRFYTKLVNKCKCGGKLQVCGPIYLGPLHEKSFVTKVKKDICKRKFKNWEKEIEFLAKIENEITVPFYYDLHVLAKKKLHKLDKIEKTISKIKKKSPVSRVHCCPTAIKTLWQP